MDKSGFNNTSVLSISSQNIKDCKDVANTLAKCGVICSVTPNYTVRSLEKACSLENGCTIILTNIKTENIRETVWNPLKKEYDLGCAYLNINGIFKGCIYDFLSPSLCPGI